MVLRLEVGVVRRMEVRVSAIADHGVKAVDEGSSSTGASEIVGRVAQVLFPPRREFVGLPSRRPLV